jgi:O-antigen/teichoic acid export membrane protein
LLFPGRNIANVSPSLAKAAVAPAAAEAAPLSLRRNVSWTFAANMLLAASNFAILQLLVKLGTPELVGQFVLGMSIATPLLLLTDLSLRSVQVTDARRETPFGDYLGMRLATTWAALVLLGGIVLAGGYSGGVAAVVLIIGGTKALESVSDIFHGKLQQSERMDWVSRSLIMRGLLSVAAVALASVATGSLAWTMAALLLTRLAVLWAYDLPSAGRCLVGSERAEKRALRPRFEPRVMARLFWLSWPLGLAVTLLSLNVFIPRYFVERFQGEAALGIFGAFAYVVIVGQMVVSALGAAASPRLARHYEAGQLKDFFNLVWRMAALCGATGLMMVCISLTAGERAVTWLYGPEYAAHVDTFTWLMIASGVGYVGAILGYATTATRRFHSLTIPYLLSALLTGALSLWLVPKYGIRGAAWVTLGFSLSNVTIGVALLWQAAKEKGAEAAGPALEHDVFLD